MKCKHTKFNMRAWSTGDHLEGEITCSDCGKVDKKWTKLYNQKLLSMIWLKNT